ncbi:XRE family transcriptional regulator [Pseudomonas sp. PDM16]|uniref:LexA family protein n=1 Tax=Pseudomonas sp. PDM16 TaxID=2769292 RepID=UPI001783A2F4|nr:XRE family transcriptional regulator [Pseudomonas sp. PDM16]MBD9415904.1 XRE family transcriptional regulator [Pseudomonas sp. PDM16]
MNQSERIRRAIELSGKKKGEIAAECGVKPSAVTQWITGETKALKAESVFALGRATGFNPEWLATGTGPERLLQEDTNLAPMLQPSRASKEYPVISWVIAGERAHSPDNFAPGVAEEWLTSTENAGLHGYWLIVKGPSMTSPTPPSFPEGTPILIRPEGFELVSGKFYIAKHRDGETTFKQYIYDGGREYLVPLNKDFRQVEMDDEWDVIGRIVDMKAPRGTL